METMASFLSTVMTDVDKYWTAGVWMASSPEEEMLDFYPASDQAAEEIIAELGILWLVRSQQEERLERLTFDQRSHLGEDTSIRGMLGERIHRFFRKK